MIRILIMLCLPLWLFGMSLERVTLLDQFDRSHTISTFPTKVIVIFERAHAAMLHAYLGRKGGATYLQQHNAMILMDISPMPTMVSSLFAIPKMRKYPYSVLLVRDGVYTRSLPRQNGAMSVYTLDRNTITHTDFVTSPEALQKALEGVTP